MGYFTSRLLRALQNQFFRRLATLIIASIFAAFAAFSDASAKTFVDYDSLPPLPSGAANVSAQTKQNGYGKTDQPEQWEGRCNGSFAPDTNVQWTCRFVESGADTYVWVHWCNSENYPTLVKDSGVTPLCIAPGVLPPACPTGDQNNWQSCFNSGGMIVGQSGSDYLCTGSIPDTMCYQGCRYTDPQLIVGDPGSWNYASNGEECEECASMPGRDCGDPSSPDPEPDDQTSFNPTPDNEGYQSGDSDNLQGFDTDGDGTPDETDTDPSDPLVGGDADQDGTPDDEDPFPNDPTQGGAMGGGFGEGSGGSYGSGLCSTAGRQQPTCQPHLDVVQCGIFLETWNRRCDAKLAHIDLIGTDEYRAGQGIGDGSGEDGFGTASFSASGIVDGLNEGLVGFQYGSCPADRTFSMPGAFGGSFTISYQPFCDFADMVRPIVIAMGYLMSGLIILRSFSKDET